MIHRVPLIVAPTRRQVLRTMAGAAGALAFPRLGRSAITFGACPTPGDGGASFVASQATGAFATTTGRTIAVWCGAQLNLASVTDTAGNTYVGNTQVTGTNYKTRWFVAENITGNAANVVTVNLSGGVGTSQFVMIFACEIVGLAPSSSLDLSPAGISQLTSSYTSAAFTTGFANEIILVGSFVLAGSAHVADTGYTIPTNGFLVGAGGVVAGALEYKIVTSIQTGVTAGFTWTGGVIENSEALITLKMATPPIPMGTRLNVPAVKGNVIIHE